jgi:hypothetical protein
MDDLLGSWLDGEVALPERWLFGEAALLEH